MKRIYVVEDEENIRELIKIALQGFGFEVQAFETAEEGMDAMRKSKLNLMIFDWMLPGMDGTDAIREIRKSTAYRHLPILLLTAKDKEIDKVIGLDNGADDYMIKPFGVLELCARIRSLLRRVEEDESGEEKAFGTIRLCPNTREIYKREERLELTYKEYELLLYLMEHETKVVTREELLNQIWGYDYTGESRTLDIHIRTLRQKIGEENQPFIKTVRGVGYRFVNE
ncbi:MAG: response regulator transcription factor [Lachnospiraceae bacterium]|nr:response regulator transcription factor [Lachnospiraceae bacterium]